MQFACHHRALLYATFTQTRVGGQPAGIARAAARSLSFGRVRNAARQRLHQQRFNVVLLRYNKDKNNVLFHSNILATATQCFVVDSKAVMIEIKMYPSAFQFLKMPL